MQSVETKLLTVANLKLLNGCRTPAAATATLTWFLGPGLDVGPIITRTDSYQSI